MAASYHERVKRVFYEASQRAPTERAAFLDEACGGMDGVRAEVESLLGFHRESPARPVVAEESATRSPRRLRAGRILGNRYRIRALLGRGGVGEVYRAWDLVLEVPVALKVLLVDNGLAREELLREVRLARQVTHPAVCRVYDIHEEDGEIFFTMEWIDGERLSALLARQGRLAPTRVVSIARQICSGLAAAHAKGIVHRDLKPENVLMDRKGGAHLTDFGTALVLGHRSLRDLLPIGTPRYMAPEQLQEGAEITPRTDLYALGLLLHEMLTGARPRPGRRPGRLRLLPPGADPRLDAVIQQALAEAPEERYPSATAMELALSWDDAPEAGRILRMPPPGGPSTRSEPDLIAGSCRASGGSGAARRVAFGAHATREFGAS